MRCLGCDTEVTIIRARHNYEISKGEDDHWGKSDGEVSYVCGYCREELSISDIAVILEQVDEL
ncbi:hypothetical protein LCGC14_2187410 [marine sediment metagenome]|uniref:Uncharacterized protein n=1 Tax=marine sediment metagenome TaxID=412755 RepID=A0A0F9E7L2_9ZZZZ